MYWQREGEGKIHQQPQQQHRSLGRCRGSPVPKCVLHLDLPPASPLLSSRSRLKSRGWSHRAWAPGRSCPAFHWRVHCRRYKCGHPLQGQCPKLVHRADTRAHPCTCTHAHGVGTAASGTVIATSSPPALQARLRSRGLQSRVTPHSQPWSHLPGTLRTTDLLGWGKPHSIAHATHPHWLVGWHSRAGTCLLKRQSR